MIPRLRLKHLIAILAFSLVSAGFFVAPTYAGDVTKVKTFSVSGYSQGATLTSDYYIYTEWSGSSFRFVRCNRSNGGDCERSNYFSKKPSSMYYKWGSEYAQAIVSVSGEMVGHVCIKISNMKEAPGKCGGMLNSDGLNNGDSNTRNHRQGWTKYGSHYFRGYGINNGETNYIWVFNSAKKLIKKWPIPLSSGGNEIEDVMVDGNNGQVWFTWGHNGAISYYKVKKSVFNRYTGGGGSSSSAPVPESTYSLGDPNDPGVAYGPEAKKVKPDYDGTIDTTMFGSFREDDTGDDKGCGTYLVLNFIIDILTWGVGIAAILGIGISGVTYLTAKGNEQQLVKSKRRMFEIVLGLVAYATLYAGLNFLLPGGKFNPNASCPTSTSSKSTTGVEPWSDSYKSSNSTSE